MTEPQTIVVLNITEALGNGAQEQTTSYIYVDNQLPGYFMTSGSIAMVTRRFIGPFAVAHKQFITDCVHSHASPQATRVISLYCYLHCRHFCTH